MKKISAMSAAFSVMLAAPLLMMSPAPARADVDFAGAVSLGFHAGDADVGVFYDSLAPYGDWVDTGRYGLCWAPRRIEQDWRPYYYGHWVYTDYGWTWVSDEEWGWAPYHYGRWVFDRAYGWIWVPGSVWAPAWVAWRWGDGYAGWAPLPPDADPSMGPADFGIDPLSFVFVQDRYIAEPVLVNRYVPPARNVTIVNVTRNVTEYHVVNNQVVNQGVPVQTVERVTGRAVPRVRIAEQTAPAPTRVRGSEVAIYRPPVPRASATPARPRTATQQPPPATTQRPPATTQQPPPATMQHPPAAAQRPPAVAPPSTTDPAELRRKQAQEQQALQAKEAQEREKLRQIHEQEKAAPPPNVSPQQLEKQHQEEQRAQAEHEQREKQAQEQRQARERQAAQQAQQQRQGHQQGQNEKPKNEKDKKKPENKQQ